jgi:hypothetical protein
MGAEMGVGPSRPIWNEVGDDRNEGWGGGLMEYCEATSPIQLDGQHQSSTLPPLPQYPLMSIVSVHWISGKSIRVLLGHSFVFHVFLYLLPTLKAVL